MSETEASNPERDRLENQHRGKEDWSLWGPYLAERAWGTVREDYSPGGDAWDFFPHDHARSRVYRWNEDGLAGICDENQILCFAIALWNGRDPYLKARAFGLTGNQGNRGEDVKEHYFYVDATPSHSFLKYRYKYPQARFPYEALVEENARRDRDSPPFNLMDAGVFDDHRYFDVDVVYSKAAPGEIHVRISAFNRGPDEATLDLLPTLWFRNTWSWGNGVDRPTIHWQEPPTGAAWAVRTDHPGLGSYHLYGRLPAEPLFTDNETNVERLYGQPNAKPYVKDSFHRFVINGEKDAINADREGTKFAAWHRQTIPASQHARIDLVLSETALDDPFGRSEVTFASRQSEANVFYDELLPEASPEDHWIMRQALAGMIWSKQFFHYDVERWLNGDVLEPPSSRRRGRNAQWKHLKAADVFPCRTPGSTPGSPPGT